MKSNREMTFEHLFEPSVYRRQIEKIFRQHRRTGKIYHISQDGITLSDVYRRRESFSRQLVKDLRSGSYNFSTAIVDKVVIEKPRSFYRLVLADLIVNGVWASALMNEMRRQQPNSFKHVFSYFPGTSRNLAFTKAKAALAIYRSKVSEVKLRGVYMARRDVLSYTDRVPVSENSPLWTQIDELIKNEKHFERIQKYYRSLVRPKLSDVVEPQAIGLPTGTPIAAAIYNLYLSPVDKILSQGENGSYFRFSDDILYFNSQENDFVSSLNQAELLLKTLGLEFNSEKSVTKFFNGAGRQSPSGTSGTNQIQWLGANLTFKGTLGLGNKKGHFFLKDIRSRIFRAERQLQKASLETKAKILCTITNQALFDHGPLGNARADFVLNVATDRGQLKHYDYLIAGYVSAALTGIQGPRSLKYVSMNDLKNKFGLKSLVVQRNKK